MNAQYQDLVSTFTDQHNLLLTSLLCTDDPETWENCKHLIICATPLLTLEMAINRITCKENNRTLIPTPKQIQNALQYAQIKKQQYHNQLVKEELQKEKLIQWLNNLVR